MDNRQYRKLSSYDTVENPESQDLIPTIHTEEGGRKVNRNIPVSTFKDYTDSEVGVVATDLSDHEADTANPHQVTKAQVGLGNVDNTSDANKPVSTATQSALDGKVGKVTTVNTLYGVNGSGNQYSYPISQGSDTSSIAQRSSGGTLAVGTPTASAHATTKAYVDAADALKVNKAGDTMTGPLRSTNINGVSYRQTRADKNIGSGVSGAGNFSVYNFTNSLELFHAYSDGTGISLGDADYAPRILHGIGSPDGVVSAPVGSTYIDRKATNGTIEWKKASGFGSTGWVTLDKAYVGLANVDNTSDVDKPVSTAQAAAIAASQATVYFGFDASTLRPITTKPVIWSGATGVVPINAIPSFDLIFSYDITAIPDIGWKATYDASTVDTVTDGALLSSWDDTVGGYTAVQANDAMKPIWRASDAAFNNKAVVDFSASSNRNLVTASWASDAQPNTIVLVGSVPAVGAATQRIIVDGKEGSARNAVGRWDGGGLGIFSGSGAVSISTGVDTNPHLIIAEVNGAASRLIIDGVPYTATYSPGAHGLTGLTIGARVSNFVDGFMGKLAFVGVLPGTISDQDAASLYAWAKGVYNL